MRQINVLLVEDNTDHSFLSQRAFDDHGDRFSLDIAQSGAEALVRLADKDYDLVFVDHQLPDTDGLSLMRKVQDAAPQTPVVVITGQGSEELAVSTFREGATDYIIKNQDYFSLLPTVAQRIYQSNQLNGQVKRPPFSADNVYEQILSASADLLDVHASSLMLFNEKRGLLETKAHRGLSHNYISRVQPKLGESLEGLALSEAKALYIHDIGNEPAYLFKDMAGNEGIRSAMSVPIFIDDSTRGVLNLYSHSEGRFDESAEKLASHLVKLSALALHNLKLYHREHHISETLQRSHFPVIDARFGDWEVAHRYKVSMEEAMLGGDFYDMFPVVGNRRAVVVADVSGKGISAAAQTAMVKYTLRSYALDDADPAKVIARTHAAFCSYMPNEHFVTIFYGVIDPVAKTIAYCSAGHPPALFYSARLKTVRNLSEVHIPVGAWHDEKVTFSTSTIAFEPGDTLLIYTDGLTDCRQSGLRSGELFGQDNLEQLFQSVADQSAEAAAEGVFSHVLGFSDGKMRDDIAFFIIKLGESS